MKKRSSTKTKKISRYHSKNKTKSSYKGGANTYQKGLAAEQRTWIKKLTNDGSIKSRSGENLYYSLCSIVHSNDVNSYKHNSFTDYKNKYDPKAQFYINKANKILLANGMKRKNNSYSLRNKKL
jgi:hypothetical protein